MMKNALLLGLVVWFMTACGAGTAVRSSSADPHPPRFIGIWEASRSEFVSDNFTYFTTSVQKETGQDYSLLPRATVEKLLRELTATHPDVNESIKIMDNGLAELSRTKNGAPDAAFLFRWAYRKGELHFSNDFNQSFMVYELAGQLIQEKSNPGFVRNVKVRYNKVP